MVHDESAFDIRNAPNIRVPPGYGRHFRSFDGKQRDLIVEAAGGPSWYTEYNVFAGLVGAQLRQVRLFRDQDRRRAGRARACRMRCAAAAIAPSRSIRRTARSWRRRRFQASTGVQNFFDMNAMRAREVEPDSFYYDTAHQDVRARARARARCSSSSISSANHFPWDYRWRPELTPGWQDLGNQPVVDEYLRRQTLGMQEYQQFLERLRAAVPGRAVHDRALRRPPAGFRDPRSSSRRSRTTRSSSA